MSDLKKALAIYDSQIAKAKATLAEWRAAEFPPHFIVGLEYLINDELIAEANFKREERRGEITEDFEERYAHKGRDWVAGEIETAFNAENLDERFDYEPF